MSNLVGIPEKWFPINFNFQYISFLKCNSTVYDLDIKVKVIFDINNGFFRCGFLVEYISYVYLALIR